MAESRCTFVTELSCPLQGHSGPCLLKGGLQEMAGQQPSWSHEGGQGMVPGGRHESSLSPFPRVSFPFSLACWLEAWHPESRDQPHILGAWLGAACCVLLHVIHGSRCDGAQLFRGRAGPSLEEPVPGGGPPGSFRDLRSLDVQGGGLNQGLSHMTLRSVIYSTMIIGC